MDAAATAYYEPFLSALQNVGVEFLHAEQKFHNIRVKFYLFRPHIILLHGVKMHFYAALARIIFRYIFVQRFPKNANYEEFLTKIVNIDKI